MKNINTKNKLIYAIIFLIVIAGTICYFTKGINFDRKYSKNDQIVISNNTGFEISKIREISEKVLLGKNSDVREVEIFKNSVLISASEINEEDKEKIIEEVNKQYNTEISKDNVKIQSIEQFRIMDIVRPYILPIAITFVLILLYFLIKYKKLLAVNVLLKAISLPLIAELFLMSIIVITRMPFGDLALAMILVVYVATLVVCTTKFNNEIDIIKEKEIKNNIQKL